MTGNIQILLIVLTSFILTSQAEFIERDTKEGKVLGRTFFTVDENKTCFAFQGIPYAEKPKRFTLPVPKVPWKGVINCTYDKSECVQGSNPVTGSEDCLTLNVYSSNLSGNAAVLFWIHGGGFTMGNGSLSLYGPDNFVNNGLVVVVIQYRLGVFGFLSTGDHNCPGNLGMKDQVLALDWTRRNIHHFGGDPNNITIAGQSAGGASVGFHLLSRMSAGKFKGAILSSGTAQCLWSLNRNAVRIAFAVGQSLGILTHRSGVLVTSLKKIDYVVLQNVSNSVSTMIALSNYLIGIQFGVVAEVPHKTAFFTGKADVKFCNGNFHRVPIFAGFTSNELGGFADSQAALYGFIMSNLDLRPWNLAPASLTKNPVKRKCASDDIIAKHFGSLPMTPKVNESVTFLNVDQFVRPINRFIKKVSNFVNAYYYMFSYVGLLGGVPNRYLPGAQHSEDMGYVWRNYFNNVPLEDKTIQNIMVTVWTNFCKHGSPVPVPVPELQNVEWLPASSRNPPFLMNINSTMGQIENPYEDFLTFYDDDIFCKYGQGYYDTY